MKKRKVLIISICLCFALLLSIPIGATYGKYIKNWFETFKLSIFPREQDTHTWGEWTNTNGVCTRVCSVCEDVETKAHDFDASTWVKENATHTGYCNDCGDTVTEAHDIGYYVHDDSTSLEASKHRIYCSVCDGENITEGNPYNCTYSNPFVYDGLDSHTHSKYCDLCNYKYTLACNFDDDEDGVDDYYHVEKDGLEVHRKTCQTQTCGHVHKAASVYTYESVDGISTYICDCGDSFSVAEDDVSSFVAVVDDGNGNGVLYYTLSSAIEAAIAKNKVVVLLKDMESEYIVTEGTKVTINPNMKKVLLHYENMQDIQIMAVESTEFDNFGTDSVITTSANKLPITFDRMADNETLLIPASVTDTANKKLSIYARGGLIDLATAVNSGTSYKGWTVTLENDVDLGYLEWTPIGSSFVGTFDGNNKKISNLFISKKSDYLGLFGYLDAGAKLQNVIIKNVNLTSDYNYVGALAGYAHNNTIQNCSVIGEIDIVGNTWVGGLIGWFRAGAVKKCSVKANINIVGSEWIGALIGYSGDLVEDCSVVGQDNSIVYATTDFAGGLIGGMYDSPIKTTGSSVEALAILTDGKYAGGITGRIYAGETISACSVSHITVTANDLIDVDPTGERLPSVGYIVGSNVGGNPSSYSATTGFSLGATSWIYNCSVGENVVARYRIGNSENYTIVQQISGNYNSQYAPDWGDTVGVGWQYTKKTVITALGYTDAVIENSKVVSGVFSRLGASEGNDIDTSVVASGSTVTYDETTSLYTVTAGGS